MRTATISPKKAVIAATIQTGAVLAAARALVTAINVCIPSILLEAWSRPRDSRSAR
jgi:hypothetical protein